MDPSRKRTVRLVVALSAAVILATALIYTSFSAASPAVTPSQLAKAAVPGHSYQLTGTVVKGSIRHVGTTTDFSVQDRTGHGPVVAVAYTGAIPDPFREGREVIVTVHRAPGAGSFVGERDSLVTKCPSKFTAVPNGKTY